MPFDPRRLPGYRLLQALRDITLGGDRRTSALLRLSGPELLFQPFGDTAPDRYPEIFAAIADGLADRSAPGLLSFGCSTGDEVFTLHRYLPQASIRGVDISADRIAICRSRLERETPETKARVRFDLAVAGDIEPAAAYDAVLAMAVFRHGDLVDGRA